MFRSHHRRHTVVFDFISRVIGSGAAASQAVSPSQQPAAASSAQAPLIAAVPHLVAAMRTPASRSSRYIYKTDRERRAQRREMTGIEKLVQLEKEQAEKIKMQRAAREQLELEKEFDQQKEEENSNNNDDKGKKIKAATAARKFKKTSRGVEFAGSHVGGVEGHDDRVEDGSSSSSSSSLPEEPSAASRHIFDFEAVTASRGRAVAVDATMKAMRGKTESVAAATSSDVVVSSFVKSKTVKRRRPLKLDLMSLSEQQHAQLKRARQRKNDKRGGNNNQKEDDGDIDDDGGSGAKKEGGVAKQDPSDVDEQPWPKFVPPSSRKAGPGGQTEGKGLASVLSDHQSLASSPVSQSPQPAAYVSTNVINDIGASKLDEIELARSGALAKKVESQLPLPVYATDEDLIQHFFAEDEFDATGGGRKVHNDVDLVQKAKREAGQTIRNLRLGQLEDLSKKFIEKADGSEIASAEMFRRNANEQKAKLSGTEAAEFVALDYKGDEAGELGELARQAARAEQEQAAKRLSLQLGRDHRKTETRGADEEEDTIEEDKEEDSSANTNKKNQKRKNNNKNLSPKISDAKSSAQSKEESSSINSGDSSGAVVVVRPKTDPLGSTPVRLRRPSSEVREQNHSSSSRFETELTTAATVLPSRRYTSDELADTSEIVRRRSEIAETREEMYFDEKQTMSPLDAHVDVTFEHKLRRGLMHYYARYPINSMIKARTIFIGGIQDEKGNVHRFEESERPRVPLAEARKIAAEHGKDLIQVHIYSQDLHPSLKGGGTGGEVVCYIADHLGYAMSFIEHFLHRYDRNGVTPVPVKPLLDVGFRGVTHDFAIRVKAIHIARFLFKKFPVRIILTRFGTHKIGFPVFERVLSFVRAECDRLKAYFIAGQVRYDSGSIYCYLHPSTVKMPLTSTEAPSSASLKETMETAMFDTEYDREVAIFESFGRHHMREENSYLKSLDDGSAWAHRSEGVTLAQQRRLKIMQGWLPKSNRKLYAARGDVDMKHPFKTTGLTGVDAVSYPRESNLEQAERAAGVLERRAQMSVSEALDKNETPSQTHTLGNFDYMMTGDVLDAGILKEQMGLKGNRKRIPQFDQGFSTLGQKEDPGVQGGVFSFD